MNATLEDRLRHHYDERTREIPEHGPGLDDGAVLSINLQRAEPRQHRAARVSLVIGSVAAATVLGFVLINRPTTEQSGVGSVGPTSSSSPTSTSPGIVVLGASEILPDTGDLTDTPVTVAGNSPTDWYRVQLDLDIAWYQEASGQSPAMLCWRTPVGSNCSPADDPKGQFPLIVSTAGGMAIVVTSGGTEGEQLDVQLTNGEFLSEPLVVDEVTGWGVARYQIPAGESITAVGNASV